jgi:thymidine kinase
MFIEPIRSISKKGWIEVICGCMFSGKTEELLRRIKRAQFANQPVEIFKPLLDKRYDEYHVISHDEGRIAATPVDSAYNILLMKGDAQVVAIDEVQFFDEGIVEVTEQLAIKGVRVIAAGLDMDFMGKPFGPMPVLLSKAEFITKLHAICVKCGDVANYSYRRAKNEDLILLGEKDMYEPRCRSCFNNL